MACGGCHRGASHRARQPLEMCVGVMEELIVTKMWYRILAYVFRPVGMLCSRLISGSRASKTKGFSTSYTEAHGHYLRNLCYPERG